MSTTTSDSIAAIRQATAAARKLTDTEVSLRTRHTDLTAERHHVYSANASLEEVLANKDRLIDAHTVRWSADHANSVARSLSGYHEERGVEKVRDFHVKPALPTLRGFASEALDFETLCGLAPDLMKKSLGDLVRGAGITFGLPAAARLAKLAELDTQIAEVEQQHSQLVDAAGEVGIVLPLLPTVAERRREEASQLAREHELAAERARGVLSVSR
jgi:hypothetical protein